MKKAMFFVKKSQQINSLNNEYRELSNEFVLSRNEILELFIEDLFKLKLIRFKEKIKFSPKILFRGSNKNVLDHINDLLFLDKYSLEKRLELFKILEKEVTQYLTELRNDELVLALSMSIAYLEENKDWSMSIGESSDFIRLSKSLFYNFPKNNLKKELKKVLDKMYDTKKSKIAKSDIKVVMNYLMSYYIDYENINYTDQEFKLKGLL